MSSEINPDRCPLCQRSNRYTLVDPASAVQACWRFATEIDAAVPERTPAELRHRARFYPHCARPLPSDADD